MVRLMCDEIIVDEKQSLKDWLSKKENVVVEKEASVEQDYIFRVKDDDRNEVSILPSSLSKETLRRLGCKTTEEAVDILLCCRLTITSDNQELNCDVIHVPYCVELSINDIPDQMLNKRIHSDIIFGSAKEAIDCVDEDDQTDCAYSHIPVKIGKRIEYFDLRDVGDYFCKALGTTYERDIESYFRSLMLWIDSKGVMPFQRIDDSTLRLPLPPTTATVLKEFRFKVKDLVDGDAVRPSSQFGDWEFDGNDVCYCMAFQGQPFIYDSLQKRARPLVLWDDLTKEAFDRMLRECHWPKDKPSLFKRSFLSCFRSTRCMFSFWKNSKEWSVLVPEAIYKKC